MKAIATALAKAQAEMGKALKDSVNPAFKSKYADLASVMDACMPALNKHGIAVIQPVINDDVAGRYYVKTVLIHESGETLDCAVPLLLGKQDMQGFGSAVTYARRYGLMAMAGIAPEDDDGNAAAAAAPRQNGTADLVQAIYDAARDGLAENATPAEVANAIADAICADFAGKGAKALSNAWDKHRPMIDRISAKFPPLRDRIVDAYENRKNELEESK